MATGKTFSSHNSYYIVSARQIKGSDDDTTSNLALHVYWGYSDNGTAVNVKTFNYGLDERWTVYQSDTFGAGNWRIVSSISGRSLDIPDGNVTRKAMLRIWNQNYSDAQKWHIIDANQTLTVDSDTYELYYIKPAINENYAMHLEAGGQESSTRVELWDYIYQDPSEMWCFVPVNLFDMSGVYEIRSYSNPDVAVDVPSGVAINGVRMRLYSVNHTDAQKFTFTNTGSGWNITNIASGMNIDNSNGTLTRSNPVIEFSPNGTIAQRWTITDNGSRVIEGTTCKAVSFIAHNGQLDGGSPPQIYALDIPNGNAQSGQELSIWTSNGTDGQMFLMYPTQKTGENLPVPSPLGIAAELGKAPMGSIIPWQYGDSTIRYPVWECPSSWINGQNHYQFRYQKRYHTVSTELETNGTGDGWTNWQGELESEEWSSWFDIAAFIGGGYAWDADGIDMGYNPYNSSNGPYDDCGVHYEVRCVAQDNGRMVYGTAGVGWARMPFMPTITIAAAELTATGLKLDFTSDYPLGPTHLKIYDVTCTENLGKSNQYDYPLIGGTVKDMLWNEYGNLIFVESGSTNIPSRAIHKLTPGAKIKVEYGVSTPQGDFLNNMDSYRWTNTVDLTFGEGNYTPEITLSDGSETERTITATIPYLGVDRMWIVMEDGSRIELSGTHTGDHIDFDVPFPFGTDFDLVAESYAMDLTKWGTNTITVSRNDPHIRKYTPAHAWSKIQDDKILGTSLVMNLRKGEPPQTSGAVNRTYTELTLSGRQYSTVSFDKTNKKTFTAEGAMYGRRPKALGSKQTATYATEELETIGHCFYRAPNGEMGPVAITKVTYNSYADEYTEFSIEMIRETL